MTLQISPPLRNVPELLPRLFLGSSEAKGFRFGERRMDDGENVGWRPCFPDPNICRLFRRGKRASSSFVPSFNVPAAAAVRPSLRPAVNRSLTPPHSRAPLSPLLCYTLSSQSPRAPFPSWFTQYPVHRRKRVPFPLPDGGGGAMVAGRRSVCRAP